MVDGRDGDETFDHDLTRDLRDSNDKIRICRRLRYFYSKLDVRSSIRIIVD